MMAPFYRDYIRSIFRSPKAAKRAIGHSGLPAETLAAMRRRLVAASEKFPDVASAELDALARRHPAIRHQRRDSRSA